MVFCSLFTAKCYKTRVKYCAVYVKKTSNGKLSDDVKDKTLPFISRSCEKGALWLDEKYSTYGQNHDFYHSIEYALYEREAKLNTKGEILPFPKRRMRYYRDLP